VNLDDSDYERLLAFRTGLRRFLASSEEQAVASGVTPAQHQLLLAVRGNPSPHGPTISDVSDTLLLKHHSAVGLVDRAESAGLVQRRRDRADGRVVHVILTERGRELLETLTAAHLEELDRLAPVLRALVRESARDCPRPSADAIH